MNTLSIQDQFDRLLRGLRPATFVAAGNTTTMSAAFVAAGIVTATYKSAKAYKNRAAKAVQAKARKKRSGYTGVKTIKNATPVAFLKDLAVKAVSNRLVALLAKTGETISSVLSKTQKEVEIIIAFSELKGESRLRQAWVDFIRVVSL